MAGQVHREQPVAGERGEEGCQLAALRDTPVPAGCRPQAGAGPSGLIDGCWSGVEPVQNIRLSS